MKLGTAKLLLFGVALSVSHAVSAASLNSSGQKAPPNNYVGASLGTVSQDTICDDYNCSEDGQSWKIYSGVRLNDNLVLEGGYLRLSELELSQDGGKQKNALSGYTLAGLATYQYSNEIELFGKAGILWWDSEVSGSAGQQDKSGSNALVGVGAHYDLGDNMGVRAEWERFESLQRTINDEKHAVDLMSLGVTFSSL